MSLIDTVKKAVGITPTYDEDARKKIRAEALKAAKGAKWFATIVAHHAEVEAAFEKVKGASSAAARLKAQKKLAVLLNGHSIAEEAIIYPSMSVHDQPIRATHAYNEQALAKREMAALDDIPTKMSNEYLNKLEEIRIAVIHHMVEEETVWFPELAKKATPTQNTKLSKVYNEEFKRYTGSARE